MEIYVSDEDNVLTEYDGVITTLVVTESVEIKSIEQHDRELLRKIECQLINYMPQDGGTTIEYLEGFHNGIRYAIKQINELLKERGVE